LQNGLILVLWYASVVSGAILVVRLFFTRLAAIYRGLTAWAILNVLASVILLSYVTNPDVYLWVSASCYLLQAVCVFFLIRTLFTSHLEAYPGIGSFAQKLLSGLVGISAVISLFAIRQDWLRAASPSDWTFTGVRILDTGFAVFLASAGIFFARYRVPTRRNVLRLEFAASIYFAVQALAFLAIILIGIPAQNPASAIVEGADLCFFAYCALALSAAGELIP
jgi:hypothetical protein